MRIGWKERRILQRRLKNRHPPAFPRSIPRVGLIVSATVAIDPSALAKIAVGDATPVLAPILIEKHWNKNELGKSMPPNPVLGLNDRLADELTALLVRMAKNQQTDKSRQAQQKVVTVQPSKQDYLLSLDGLKDPPTTRTPQAEALWGYIGSEGNKAGNEHIKERINVIRNLNQGLNFDLNLRSIFQGNSKSSNKSGAVRYGLILKDIKPDMNAPHRAAINDMVNEIEYAGHANVEWTIGPLDEERGRSIYQEPTTADEGIFDDTMLKSLKIPKPNFRGRIKPELADLAGLKGNNLPVWTIEVSQEEGYYTLVQQVKSTGARVGQEHRFKFPIYADTNVGRRFNDKWQAIETSAYNILVDKNLPIISLHQMHIEQRYRVEASKRIGPHRIGFEHKSEAQNPAAVKEKERPESYTLKYETNF